jgi:hypothetical protein
MRKITFAVAGFTLAIALAVAKGSAQTPTDGPQYQKGNVLVLPSNYREWTWISSGLGMTYEGDPNRTGPPTFTNVFVNPSSYRSFMKTGRWPDKTMFILEFRESEGAVSINKAGRFQGAVQLIEAEVKDSRFPDGWAFYNFGPANALKTAVEPLADASRCVECHTKHTAVERTFVQFYPTLMDVARRMKTVKPGF